LPHDGAKSPVIWHGDGKSYTAVEERERGIVAREKEWEGGKEST